MGVDSHSWSEYHDVPARLADVYDFANTLDQRTFGDHRAGDSFAGPAELTQWLADRELVSGDARGTSGDLALAMRLRTVLRGTAEANRGGAVPTGQEQALTDLVRRLPLRAGPDGRGQLTLESVGDGVRGALAGLLAVAVLATADGSWCRVKMCAAEDCRVVFYDHSKPRNGRWCSTAGCGNRAKTSSYRSRRRQ